jgi:hypothetical protein
MGQHQHDVDELARICLELAEESALPLERDALIELPVNYRAEAASRTNQLCIAPSHDLPNSNFWEGRTPLSVVSV